MPGKGFFTQGVAVLLERDVPLDEVERALSGLGLVSAATLGHQLPRPDDDGPRSAGDDTGDDWAMSGPGLLYELEAPHGGLSVDLVSRPWPDDMGDPTSDASVFAAWSMGHFGPGTFPDGLARAMEQNWQWAEALEVASRHTAFARIRTSYIYGAPKEAPVIPDGYDPVAELILVTKVASALMKLPPALAYFNPSGELLLNAPLLDEGLQLYAREQISGPQGDAPFIPQDLWCNVRMVRLADHESIFLMDTVGMIQLDAPDHEALFSKAFDPSEVAWFLRNIAEHVFLNGPVIKDGDAATGPEGVNWRASVREDATYLPDRKVIRWIPSEGFTLPPDLE